MHLRALLFPIYGSYMAFGLDLEPMIVHIPLYVVRPRDRDVTE